MAKGYLQNLLEENIDDKLKIDPSGALFAWGCLNNGVLGIDSLSQLMVTASDAT